ncbi:hypothetical protein SAY87_031434 [Trapa incisa]|uniref:Uncharacterized protein n=1 Tax=Trapa incisa TaxID=236973 RepID=A0AAN7KXJ7_9MYRT|nr:hypothetical protein SAY87_031434 [Trapa incisa]
MEVMSIFSPLNIRAVIASSISMAKPLRFAPRKNHLRPKILKTLPSKPIPAPIKIEIPLTEDVSEDSMSDASLVGLPSTAETSERDELNTSGSVVEEILDLGKFSTKSMIKYGAYFIGFFLFQTICAVWMLMGIDEKSNGSELGVDEEYKDKSMINGNAGRYFPHGKVSPRIGSAALYLEESEVEEKIEEIRLMAREARRLETKNLKGYTEGIQVEEELTSNSRFGFDKEIDFQLKKMEKKLKSVKKSPALRKDVSRPEDPGNGLVFKKKLKYRDASSRKNSQCPKGFGSENLTPPVSDGTNSYQELQSDDPDIENGTKTSVLLEEVEVEDSEGALLQSGQGSSLNEVVNSGSYGELSLNKSQSFDSIGDSSKKSPISMRRDDAACFWWLNLPCVFAILMRRGSNHEGPEGLFTLKIGSDKDDKSVSSYVIGFEDRADANNFCFLLESFFEDLSDFTSDIVPLLKKELEAAVEAKTMNIFVLKKGQLRLYAGQPFPDVEMELVSLVKENESAYG